MNTLRLIILLLCCQAVHAVTPSLYDGRFRPVENAAALQLQEWSRNSKDALKTLQELHRRGPDAVGNRPLLYVQRADLKRLLDLPLKQMRFTPKQIRSSFKKPALHALLRAAYWESYISTRARRDKQELSQLAPDLWVVLKQGDLTVAKAPGTWPWNQVAAGDKIGPLDQRPSPPLVEEALQLLQNLGRLETPVIPGQAPLTQQLLASGEDFRMLPIAQLPGQWASLRALTLETDNFTPYSDDEFKQIRTQYFHWRESGAPQHWAALNDSLSALYARELAGHSYLSSHGKSLHYPYMWQLTLEETYSTVPFIPVCIALYALAAVLLLIKRGGYAVLLTAFVLHTVVLLIRCAILERPPVSNMFETVIYVPWISSALALTLRQGQALPVAAVGNVALLLLLQFTGLSQSLENVQAVLDSQYWLSIHVMMVVGSYGVFLLAGLLGHLYLLARHYAWKDEKELKKLAKSILHCLYIGSALLIPGTILGGVWAAQSWGRFWDWDPKESWAFISSAIYLLWIHAFRFGKIRDLGLAIGSIVGLMAISFTWYGVNYILGTGLHSYGFGSGGEIYYYAYLSTELLFLAAYSRHKHRSPVAV